RLLGSMHQGQCRPSTWLFNMAQPVDPDRAERCRHVERSARFASIVPHFSGRRHPMNQEIPGALLLDRKVIEDPYPFYRQLHRYAPVWRVPGTEVFVVSSFALLAEAVTRVEDFSSNIRCLLYRDENGLPARLPFDDSSTQTLATADPPAHTAEDHGLSQF